MKTEKKKLVRQYQEKAFFNLDYWQRFVVPLVLLRDKFKCQHAGCGSVRNLDVAHKRYGKDITIDDLVTYCRKHHKEFDKK